MVQYCTVEVRNRVRVRKGSVGARVNNYNAIGRYYSVYSKVK